MTNPYFYAIIIYTKKQVILKGRSMEKKLVLIGGWVRDELIQKYHPELKIEPHDKDYVAIGYTEKEMDKLYGRKHGKQFPVWVDKDGNEIALARTEIKTGNKHTDFKFIFSPETSLKEDCERRNHTINAIAKDLETGEYIDYFGGINDIKNKIIRCINPKTFIQDPLRVLILCRQSAQLGFSAEIMTLQLCREMVEKGMLDHLTPERIWKEFDKALHTDHFEYFINNLSYTKALGVILPEIDVLKNIEEIPEHHPEKNTFNHTVLALKYADENNLSAIVKLGILFHDIGKAFTPEDVLPHHYGHEDAGLELVDKICDRLRIPNDYRDFAKLSCKYHMALRRIYEMKPGHMYNMLEDITKGFRYVIPLKLLFQVSEADMYGRGKTPSDEKVKQLNKSYDMAWEMYSIINKTSADDFPELIEKADQLSGKEFGELYRMKLIQHYCDVRTKK